MINKYFFNFGFLTFFAAATLTLNRNIAFAADANPMSSVQTTTVSAVVAGASLKVADCSGPVNASPDCVISSAAVNARLKWLDNSFVDWAGSVGRARLSIINMGLDLKVNARVVFNYVPAKNVSAVVLKMSAGGQDLAIDGALDDFTDVEGRRVIALKQGSPIKISINFEKQYSAGPYFEDFAVELEPVEFY